jgi:hypothetical protein
MANVISNRSWRDKYRLNTFDKVLRGALVTEAITTVDRSNNLRIQNPWGSEPVVTVQALNGTYSVADFTLTDDVLTVTDEFIVAEHVFDFQSLLTNFDLFASRVERQAFAVKSEIDKYVLNTITADAGTLYATAAGGFSVANVNKIFADIQGLLIGYEQSYNSNLYIVLNNTDISALMQAGAVNGFTFSDSVLNNGKVSNWMGVDIYVVRAGTYIDGVKGTKTFANADNRVAGVKKVCTASIPTGYKVDEKAVSGKTGMELVSYGYVGAKVWFTNKQLTINITVTP